jgi:DNA ligase (NAD+)
MFFQAPNNCPCCNIQLILSDTGVDLICPNYDGCEDQIVYRISYYCQRQLANITGLSEKTVRKLVQEGDVKNIADLYSLDYQKISNWEGFGQKSMDNLKKSINKSLENLIDYKFLAGLGIDGIGPEVAKLILKQIYVN